MFCRHEDGTEVMITLPGAHHSIDDLTVMLKDFLGGCGFSVDGDIEYIRREENNVPE